MARSCTYYASMLKAAGKNIALAMQGIVDADRDRAIDDALDCPCVGDIKEGPCGVQFMKAYTCFLRNKTSGDEENDGSECVKEFLGMQDCMRDNEDYYKDFLKATEGLANPDEDGKLGAK